MSSSAALILEDNPYKVESIFIKYRELLENCPVYIARSVVQAQDYIATDPGTLTLFLDHELKPGCGNGMEFLEWAFITCIHFINRVVITTKSIEQSKAMRRLCSIRSVPYEVL